MHLAITVVKCVKQDGIPRLQDCRVHQTACPTNTPVWIFKVSIGWTWGGGGGEPCLRPNIHPILAPGPLCNSLNDATFQSCLRTSTGLCPMLSPLFQAIWSCLHSGSVQ